MLNFLDGMYLHYSVTCVMKLYEFVFWKVGSFVFNPYILVSFLHSITWWNSSSSSYNLEFNRCSHVCFYI